MGTVELFDINSLRAGVMSESGSPGGTNLHVPAPFPDIRGNASCSVQASLGSKWEHGNGTWRAVLDLVIPFVECCLLSCMHSGTPRADVQVIGQMLPLHWRHGQRFSNTIKHSQPAQRQTRLVASYFTAECQFPEVLWGNVWAIPMQHKAQSMLSDCSLACSTYKRQEVALLECRTH